MGAISFLLARSNTFPTNLRIALFSMTMLAISNALIITGLDEEAGIQLPIPYMEGVILPLALLGAWFCVVWIFTDNFTHLQPGHEWMVSVHMWACILCSTPVLMALGVASVLLLIIPVAIGFLFGLLRMAAKQVMNGGQPGRK